VTRESLPQPLYKLLDFVKPIPRAPRRFAQETPGDLLGQLGSDAADDILAEAEALFAEPQDRIDGVERRATSLQGSVAIAATLTLAGGGLIIDPSKVTDDGWRVALAVGVGLVVVLLVFTGMRAHTATNRRFSFRAPADSAELMDRAAKAKPSDYKRQRAAYLLWAYGRNNEIAAVKVEYLWKAAFWFRLALLALLLLVGLVVGYAVSGDPALPAK
jgi:hypothetical protein